MFGVHARPVLHLAFPSDEPLRAQELPVGNDPTDSTGNLVRKTTAAGPMPAIDPNSGSRSSPSQSRSKPRIQAPDARLPFTEVEHAHRCRAKLNSPDKLRRDAKEIKD